MQFSARIKGLSSKLIPLFLVLSLSGLLACRKKYEHCDNATVCVKNIGSNKIAYTWNGNSLADTLNPGQTTCTNAGEFNADPKNQSGEIVYFTTKDATWAIKTIACNTKKEIDH